MFHCLCLLFLLWFFFFSCDASRLGATTTPNKEEETSSPSSSTSPSSSGSSSSFHKIGTRLSLHGKDEGVEEKNDRSAPSDFASLMAQEVLRREKEEVTDYEGKEDGSEKSFDAMRRKYEVPRKYAKPVERIMSALPPPSSSRPFFLPPPDYYAIIGVSKKASLKTISLTYRKTAKLLHPDKNPHPESKKAFEAFSTAYELLSDPSVRSSYDKELKLRRRRKYSPTVLWKRMKHRAENFYATALLFFSHLRDFELGEEYEAIVHFLREKVGGVRDVIRSNFFKVKFAPTTFDKTLVVGEMLLTRKFALYLLLLFFGSSMI